jgi:DNA-binding response OmpR family regulator
MATTGTTGGGSQNRRALVVEDEPNIPELVVLHLGLEGLAVSEAASGDDAIRQAEAEPFDLIVLDLMLPNVDGVTVCRAIRRSSTNADAPILMLTARREESDKVLGLESGADDYLTKPFGVRELVARARALLRRPRSASATRPSSAADEIQRGNLRLDRARRRVTLDDQVIDLTPHEFDVLYLLASHSGIVFTRDRLLEQVWSNDTHVRSKSGSR